MFEGQKQSAPDPNRGASAVPPHKHRSTTRLNSFIAHANSPNGRLHSSQALVCTDMRVEILYSFIFKRENRLIQVLVPCLWPYRPRIDLKRKFGCILGETPVERVRCFGVLGSRVHAQHTKFLVAVPVNGILQAVLGAMIAPSLLTKLIGADVRIRT